VHSGIEANEKANKLAKIRSFTITVHEVSGRGYYSECKNQKFDNCGEGLGMASGYS